MWKFPTIYILGFGGYVETICYNLMLMNHCYLCVIMQKCSQYFGQEQFLFTSLLALILSILGV
jgi:hypothetical protein